jgi:hypothetical protein
MALDKDGGAVFLTQPDGSTQLFLLTPDQKRQVVRAEAWMAPPPQLQTYSVSKQPYSYCS